MTKLAIVIPAYKSAYFSQTLLSIANQSCKDFTLYIGNDFSPYNLKELVDLYSDRINIVYQAFGENLGRKDLVAQWERCIDMVGDEDWIWLFSDDDIMDPTCVERFYSAMNKYPHFDLFHFNVTQIDENDKIIRDLSTFPKVLTSEEFLKCRLNGNLYSFVVEYIFRKSHFFNMGRFEQFDLAWCSDDATWIKLGKRNGILNIDNAKVYWRESPLNISPNNWDKNLLKRKFTAQVDFAKWIYDQSNQNKIQIENTFLKYRFKLLFFKTIKARIDFISFRMLTQILSQFYLSLYQEKHPIQKTAFFYTYKIYRLSKEILKKILFWNYLKVKIKIHLIYF